MVASLSGQDSLQPISITGAPGDQVSPSVADSAGGSYGVAWASASGITVRFFDVAGAVDPGLGTIQLTIAANAQDVSLTAGGADPHRRAPDTWD